MPVNVRPQRCRVQTSHIHRDAVAVTAADKKKFVIQLPENGPILTGLAKMKNPLPEPVLQEPPIVQKEIRKMLRATAGRNTVPAVLVLVPGVHGMKATATKIAADRLLVRRLPAVTVIAEPKRVL